jgi:hypothetical protein
MTSTKKEVNNSKTSSTFESIPVTAEETSILIKKLMFIRKITHDKDGNEWAKSSQRAMLMFDDKTKLYCFFEVVSEVKAPANVMILGEKRGDFWNVTALTVL